MMDARIFSSLLVFSKSADNHENPPKCVDYAKFNEASQLHHSRTNLVFNVEEALLKSSSTFHYFMLVALEGGGILRALLLLVLYPFLCIVGEEMMLKIMVFICFFGIKKDKFRLGRSVLPKYFLENVGLEGFELVMRFGRKVAVSKLPRVMVECFLKDYLGIEDVIGREIKVAGGYYLGLMEDKPGDTHYLKEIFASVKSQVIGIASTRQSLTTYCFGHCKVIYLVSEDDKKYWNHLPRDKYPKPLIFHDGRLAFEPTPLATLAMFMYLPLGIPLCIFRFMVGVLLPYKICTPILAFIGVRYSSSKPLDHYNHNEDYKSNGLIYVSNHRTVLDPLYIQHLCRKPLTALVYSISKLSEILATVKTITLTRNRDKDAAIMLGELTKGRIVVICPEGTTCREPYLLRFSALFAEVSDNIVPLAIENKVGMFYGTTASGLKALDPFFFMLNPWSYYHVKVLDKLPKENSCGGSGLSKYDVANYVQAEIGRALGYKCTHLTRKDKYLILAGNDGVVH